MKNEYIISQTKNIIMMAENYKKMLQISATKDDGQIDKEEEKAIKTIEKRVEKFISKISKVIE